MQATRSTSTHRLLTWALFAVLVVAGLALEKLAHEMHLSKLLIFAGIGVWARELPKTQRWALLAMVGLLWLMILVPWYQNRNQRLVPIGKGAWRVENN